jgi:hypothetical protein
MGLTIHYSLRTPLTQAADVRLLVDTLREHARDLPFKEVGDLVEFQGPKADYHQGDRGDEHRWFKIQACGWVHEGDQDFPVQPLHAVGFSTHPGEGCESANFGLCRYPAYVERPSPSGGVRRHATCLDGWRWSSFCKTQYASDPDCGGVENFLRCHLCVVKLLDFARSTGLVTVEVNDEGGYWEHRSLEQLAREVGEWNEMIAAVVGVLKDQAQGQGTALESAIGQFPNFEHLEAKGRQRLESLRTRLGGQTD